MLKQFWQNHKGVFWVLALYAGGLLLFVAVHFVGFAQNRMAYASGALAPQRLTVDDFELIGLEQREDGTLYCLTTDPQLIAKDGALAAENLRITADYSLPPLLVNVFWAAEGEDYSVRHMAYPTGGADDGQQTFLLPAAGAQRLRIDPGTAAGNAVTIKEIVINEKRPFWQFFIPGGGEMALLLMLPGLLACASMAVVRLVPRRRAGKAGERHG